MFTDNLVKKITGIYFFDQTSFTVFFFYCFKKSEINRIDIDANDDVQIYTYIDK